jgi:hypothetical protein
VATHDDVVDVGQFRSAEETMGRVICHVDT